jgi:hypothetical protein
LLLCLPALIACDSAPQPGSVLDEAQAAGRDTASLAPRDEAFFAGMDPGIPLDAAAARGRDTWLVWTGGNDRFWNEVAQYRSFGTFDLLKTVSSHPSLKFGRNNRWQYLGLVNEPCFEAPGAPRPDRFGLWLDARKPGCAADPFEDEAAYPGVKAGARGRTVPVGSFYGYATGVVGLRLFPNPDFDEAAARNWDPERYYTDPGYFRSKDLVRPYRVGMSCAFCHVGPVPTNPPADPENPAWENLSSTVGAQYFWVDRIFSWEANPANFIFQLLHTSRPGALDTSLVSTDYINNPRTMNAVYELKARLDLARRWGRETLAGDELANRHLPGFFQSPQALSPRILKDGSDSVGALAALNRVYLNIGLFSEEWLLHFRPFTGGMPITPIRVADAEKNSAYWRATAERTPDMAAFLIAAGQPHRLADAPGGQAWLTQDQEALRRGKTVFADNCAGCHSSKIPAGAPGLDQGAGCAGPGYLDCWNAYWNWTRTEEFRAAMRQMVLADDFLAENFLSTDLRVPATLLQTNACSPLATNAIGGNIWDNFSSQTYKTMPAVGRVTVQDPFTGEERGLDMPGGGRGYIRPASLISLWSTAPFLQNNSLGRFDWRGSVEGRMASFNDSIEQLLWPEKRRRDMVLAEKLPGWIDRLPEPAFFFLPRDTLPGPVTWLIRRLRPHWLDGDGTLRIGPFPAGTPVNLLSNLELVPDGANLPQRLWHVAKLAPSLLRLGAALWSLPPDASGDQISAAFEGRLQPLLRFSKCPDFVVNRGHYFGTGQLAGGTALSDAEKRDLIEFLKTF